jgi:nickel transport protein
MKVRALLIALVLVGAIPTLAHGVQITHEHDPATGTITVRAQFETGESLAEAQVAIFAPNDFINPWATGVADADGAYTFTPDYSIEGNWDVQMRLAGHGGLVHLALTSDMAGIGESDTDVSDAGANDTNASIAQAITKDTTSDTTRTLSAGAVLVALMGVALYFQRRQQNKDETTHAHS